MLMKYKDLGTMLSKDAMKGVKGGYAPCEPPVCSYVPCPNCKYHCESNPGDPFTTHCVANNAGGQE